VGISQDARMMLTDHNVMTSSTLELSLLSERYHETEGGTSLAYMSDSVLNIKLDKKGARCSDWERRDLTPQQIDYAAADAWVAYEIFQVLFLRAMKERHDSEIPSILEFCSEFMDRRPVKVIAAKRNTEKKEMKVSKRKEYPARKEALYENCRMVSPTGETLCTCSAKKLKWYIERGLADQVSEDPPTIRLRFQPNGSGHSGDPYYLGHKENICVVCGATDKLVRHSIVPHSYRRHFDVKDKSRSSHDIVLVCQKCLQKISSVDMSLRQLISMETGISLAGVNPKYIISPELQRAKKCAKVFICNNSENLPEAKMKQYKEVIGMYLQKDPEQLTMEDYKQVVTEDLKKPNPDHKPHEEEVIEAIKNDRDKLEAFVHRWRRNFRDKMRPQHLPDHWTVDRPLDFH